jgi:integrase
MPKIARELTPIEISRLKTPGLVSVGGVPGLSMQVSPTLARSWILRVKVGGKRRDMGLGAYPGVSLAKAREKARDAREAIEQGNDPILNRERARSLLRAEQESAVTFESAARSYIKAKSPEWKGSKSLTQWTNSLENYAFPVIGKLHVQDVHDVQILKILEPIWHEKTETAVRVRGRIENILDWATAKKLRKGENPARWRGHLDKLLPAPGKITPVKHYEAVQVDDAPAFYSELKACKGTAARALEFTLLTVARSANSLGATWGEIDFEKSLWTIQAEKMKAGKEHRVPLTESAIKILRQQPRFEGCDLVFVSPRGKQFSDMAMTSVMRRLGLQAVPHGFRSTFTDWAADRTDYPVEMSKMAKAHPVSDAVEAAYRRGVMLQKRCRMMEDWASFLSNPLPKATSANTPIGDAA